MDKSKDGDEYTDDKEKPENNEDILVTYVLAYLTHNGVPIINKVGHFLLKFIISLTRKYNQFFFANFFAIFFLALFTVHKYQH